MLTLYEVGFNNFLFFKKESIDLRDYGSYLIIGENKDVSSMDSNGSGKTLVYDGITACIFNRTIRGSRINDFVGKWRDTVSVYTLFDDKVSGQVYRIKRWGGKKRKVEFKNISTGEDLTKGTPTDTDLAIVRWLGHDFDVFRNTVYSGHGDLDKFLDVTDNKRKDLLSKIRSFVNFKGCVKDAKLRKKRYQDIVLDLEYNISELNNRIQDARESIKDMKKISKNFERDRGAKINRLVSKRVDCENNIREEHGEKSSLKKVNDLIISFKEGLREYYKSIDKIPISIEKYEELHEKLLMLDNNVKGALYNVEEIKKHLASKSIGTYCDVCGTYISEEIFKENIKFNKKNLILVQKVLDEETIKRNKRRKKYKKKISNINERKKLLDIIKGEEFKISRLKDQKRLIVSNIEKIDKYRDELKEIDNDIKLINLEKSPIISGVKKIRARINEHEVVIIKCRKKLKKAKSEVEVSDFWVHGFGKNGIQNMTLDDVIEVLEDGFSIYLDELTSGAISVEFDVVSRGKGGKDLDRFGVLITDNIKDSTHEFRTWSGGEKSVIRFAGDFAFYDLVKANIDLFMLDERLDGMDVSLRAKALSMLGNMKEDRKIICTTHHGEAVSFFDHIIKVTRKDGRSKIKRLQ